MTAFPDRSPCVRPRFQTSAATCLSKSRCQHMETGMKRVGLALLVSIACGAGAQTQTRPQILVLGTFHMNNPGRDIHSTQVDDVLAPKRQQEMAELLAVLGRFRPTKI